MDNDFCPDPRLIWRSMDKIVSCPCRTECVITFKTDRPLATRYPALQVVEIRRETQLFEGCRFMRIINHREETGKRIVLLKIIMIESHILDMHVHTLKKGRCLVIYLHLKWGLAFYHAACVQIDNGKWQINVHLTTKNVEWSTFQTIK